MYNSNNEDMQYLIVMKFVYVCCDKLFLFIVWEMRKHIFVIYEYEEPMKILLNKLSIKTEMLFLIDSSILGTLGKHN